MIGWAIDRDYLDKLEGERTRVGYGQTEREADLTAGHIVRRIEMRTDLKASEIEEPVRFRALDDDGNVYYGGAVTYDWLMGEEDHAYGILGFVEADAGATDVQFRASDLPEHYVERHRSFGGTVTDGGTEWLIVYG